MSPDSPTQDPILAPGTPVTIVKLKPDGTEAIRYPGEAISSPPLWVAARAPWEQRRVDLGYLVFEPDDVFFEYFALYRPFNAFSIFTKEGQLKGWYCNVTHPSWVDDQTIYWHDLYIDVIAYPDGRTLVLDEDELAESRLLETDPTLHGTILAMRDELLRMVAECEFPFNQVDP
ncbi:MAG: DUF402 domain-containing protein [Nitrolancea sp.]